MDDEIRLQKEQFVSNLNGTTWQEIDGIQLFTPLCVMFLSTSSAFILQGTKRPLSAVGHIPNLIFYLGDFAITVLPLLLALTIFSDYLAAFSQFLMAVVFLTLAVLCLDYRSPSVDAMLSANMEADYVGWYRAYINILTAICILAVDFNIYPRRLAKTETFGTGLMDIFVGSFIMCNSLVCKEARDPSAERRSWRDKLSTIKKVLTSSLPLTVLGVARLVATKSANYQEHLTEYGVHWNFFITLAATRVLCTLMICAFKPSKALLMSVTCAVTYQYMLNHRLQEYILRPGGRNQDLVSANREGVFSLFGYMSLYLAGVAVGQLIFYHKRSTVGQHLKLAVQLLVVSGGALAMQLVAERYGIQTSRRMANFPFILWTIHHSVLLVAAMLLVAVLRKILDVSFGAHMSTYNSSILEAVNYNALLYFLLANVLTGAVNLLVKTLERSMAESLSILTVYLFTLTSLTYVLYLFKVRTKFW